MQNIFEDIDKTDVALLIEKGLRDSDEGELFFETTPSESFIFDDGRLKNSNFDINSGFGIRMVSGETTGYANSTILNKKSIEKALETVQAAKIGDNVLASDKTKKIKNLNNQLYSNANPLNSVSFNDKVKLVRNIDNFLRSYDNRVQQVSVSYQVIFNQLQFLTKTVK